MEVFMKKTLTLFLALTFILTSLTACKGSNSIDESKTESSFAEISTITSSETSSTQSTVIESAVSTSDITSVEKVVGIYGETEIPDIHITSDGEGKALSYEESDQLALEQSLDSMIFETHTFGEYTVRLVGDKVRTDEANFPGSIYTQKLRIECEKNGVMLYGYTVPFAYFNEYVNYMSLYKNEFRLLTDRIGSYLDWYELENPVLAVKYYYEAAPGITVTKVIDFNVIRNDKIHSMLLGIFDKGIGVDPLDTGDDPEHPRLTLHEEEYGIAAPLGAFSADKFRIADSNTLIDDEAGVKYTFDFEGCFNYNSPKLGHLYTAEWIR